MASKEPADFYQYLRSRIKEWAASVTGKNSKWVDYILFAPDLFHLLWKLSTDPRIAAPEKIKLLAAIAYFISPLDLMPEILFGPFGFIDDIAVAAFVLNGIINKTPKEIIDSYWAGDQDVLQVIQKILQAADDMIGAGLWQKIKRNFS